MPRAYRRVVRAALSDFAKQTLDVCRVFDTGIVEKPQLRHAFDIEYSCQSAPQKTARSFQCCQGRTMIVAQRAEVDRSDLEVGTEVDVSDGYVLQTRVAQFGGEVDRDGVPDLIGESYRTHASLPHGSVVSLSCRAIF